MVIETLGLRSIGIEEVVAMVERYCILSQNWIPTNGSIDSLKVLKVQCLHLGRLLVSYFKSIKEPTSKRCYGVCIVVQVIQKKSLNSVLTTLPNGR